MAAVLRGIEWDRIYVSINIEIQETPQDRVEISYADKLAGNALHAYKAMLRRQGIVLDDEQENGDEDSTEDEDAEEADAEEVDAEASDAELEEEAVDDVDDPDSMEAAVIFDGMADGVEAGSAHGLQFLLFDKTRG